LNLESGITYSLYVTATNFNGESEPSDITRIVSCVRPFDVEAPALVETTALTAKLRWSVPHNGGCTISSYSVYSDLGVEVDGFVNNLEPVTIENDPYLFEHTFTFTSSETGF
jgi:hypothetical protein